MEIAPLRARPHRSPRPQTPTAAGYRARDAPSAASGHLSAARDRQGLPYTLTPVSGRVSPSDDAHRLGARWGPHKVIVDKYNER